MRRRHAGALALIEHWDAAASTREIRARDRVLVLFHASWCPYSRAFLATFEDAEPEANVPFAAVDLRHPMDARWDEHRIATVPTLVYFEHGEELERCDAVRGKGLKARDLDEILDTIAGIEEEPRLPKRMHGPRRA